MQRSVSDGYRPHLRIGDGEYLGISFFDVDSTTSGTSLRAKASLMYWPDIDYSGLVPGVHFSVMEGAHVVGQGTVVTAWNVNV